jgi:hypothetical protein
MTNDGILTVLNPDLKGNEAADCAMRGLNPMSEDISLEQAMEVIYRHGSKDLDAAPIVGRDVSSFAVLGRPASDSR